MEPAVNIVLTSARTGLGLGSLGDYGGPTPTMAALAWQLRPLARDRATRASTELGRSRDQRGLTRVGPQPRHRSLPDRSAGRQHHRGRYGIVLRPHLSLRQAVNLANVLGGDTESITFSSTVFGTAQTITLTAGQLELSSGSPTITGPAAGVTISGGGASRVFQIDSGVTASISGLTITGGSATYGGGLDILGNATLTDCTISGNTASKGGGGLFSQGTAMLIASTVSGNTAGGTGTHGYGGGLFTQSQNLLSLTNCTIASNTASTSGGGIEAQGPVTVTSCTFTANQASPISGGGGGIDNPNGGESTITIEDSILSGDSCVYGPEVANAVTSLGHNLVSNTANSPGWISFRHHRPGRGSGPARSLRWDDPDDPAAPRQPRHRCGHRGRLFGHNQTDHHRRAQRAARLAQAGHRRLPEPGIHPHVSSMAARRKPRQSVWLSPTRWR